MINKKRERNLIQIYKEGLEWQERVHKLKQAYWEKHGTIMPLELIQEELGISIYDLARKVRSVKAACNEIILGNIRLVIYVALRCIPERNRSLTDYFSEGIIGFKKGLKKFDTTRNVRLCTYCYFWIRQAIMKALNEQDSVLRRPIHAKEDAKKIQAIVDKLSEQHGRPPTLKELEEKNVSIDDIRKMEITHATVSSLDVETEDGVTYIDIIESEEPSATQLLLEQDLKSYINNTMKGCLDEQELKVISKRYGFEDGIAYNLTTTARSLCLTRDKVKKIEAKAIAKLRTMTPQYISYLTN